MSITAINPTAELQPPENPAVAEPAPGAAPDRTMLYGISWTTYLNLLADLRDRGAPRLTYDQGTLEILSPTTHHERLNRRLAALAAAVAEEWGTEIEDVGSLTFKRTDLKRGFEPDTCFYIQHAAQVADREEIDLESGDPAPDLVIEIDVTSPSLAKLPLYANIGVPEVWRATAGGQVSILTLVNDAYAEAEESLVLAGLTRTALEGFLAQSRVLTRLPWLQRVRAWAREHLPASDG